MLWKSISLIYKAQDLIKYKSFLLAEGVMRNLSGPQHLQTSHSASVIGHNAGSTIKYYFILFLMIYFLASLNPEEYRIKGINLDNKHIVKIFIVKYLCI